MGMGKNYVLLISVASFCGVVQSVIWAGLAAFGCLTYLCVVFVAPYEEPGDFFRVTFVKLYFEGPKCIPNGSYLGKFAVEYRDPDKINLFTPDIIFTILIVTIIFHAAYMILCIVLYNANKSDNHGKLADLLTGWSVLTLVMSTLESFLSAEFLFDIFSLTEYLRNNEFDSEEVNLRGIEFIPMILGLISCRLVVFWIWNVFIALWFLFVSLCCRKKLLMKRIGDSRPESLPIPYQVQSLSKELKKKFTDVRHRPYNKSPQDWDLYSMEAITRFNDGPDQGLESSYVERAFTVNCSLNRPYSGAYEDRNLEKGEDYPAWEETNAAYVKDDGDFENEFGNPDFNREIGKSEEESNPIKIGKRPVGKPVSVPVPPPLPKSDSFLY